MKKHLKCLVFLISFTLLLWIVSDGEGESADRLTFLGPQYTPSDNPPITTTSNDAVYGIPFLDDFNPESFNIMEGLPRGPNGGYLLAPGNYSSVTRAYCLKTLSYAPNRGDGYLYAPLKGSRADVIRKILRRSVDHPEISQDDIQVLLWSLIEEVPINKLPVEKQCPFIQLLTEEEIFNMDGSVLDYGLLETECSRILRAKKYSGGIEEYSEEDYLQYLEDSRAMLESYVEQGLVPEEVLEIYRSMPQPGDYSDMVYPDERQLEELEAQAEEWLAYAEEMEEHLNELLTNVYSSYEALERIAVLFGEPSPKEGDVEFLDGRWSYHPDGYFIRFFPDGYTEIEVQVLVPEPADILQDEKGRIIKIEDSNGNRLEIAYDDTFKPLQISGEPELSGYRFKSVRFEGLSPDIEGESICIELKNEGWTLLGVPKGKGRIKKSPNDYPGLKDRYDLSQEHLKELIVLDEALTREGGEDTTMNLFHLTGALEDIFSERIHKATLDSGTLHTDKMDLSHYSIILNKDLFISSSNRDMAKKHVLSLVKAGWMYETKKRWMGSVGDQSSNIFFGYPIRAGIILCAYHPSIRWLFMANPISIKSRGVEFDPSGIVAVSGRSGKQRLGISLPPKEPPAKEAEPPKKIEEIEEEPFICDQINMLKLYLRWAEMQRDYYKKVSEDKNNPPSSPEDLDKRVDELMKKEYQRSEDAGEFTRTGEDVEEPGHYNVETDTIFEVDICSDNITPWPLCKWMNGMINTHETTHRNDALKNENLTVETATGEKITRGETDWYLDPSTPSYLRAQISAKWEIHAYDEQVKYIEDLLDILEYEHPECF